MVGGAPTTITVACDKFIEDAKARGLRETTIYKYHLLFRRMEEFAKSNGLVFITAFDLDWTPKFRESWPNKNLGARKQLEYFRAFPFGERQRLDQHESRIENHSQAGRGGSSFYTSIPASSP